MTLRLTDEERKYSWIKHEEGHLANTIVSGVAITVLSAVILGGISTLKQPAWWCDQSFVQCANRDPPTSPGVGHKLPIGQSTEEPGTVPKAKMGLLIAGVNLQGSDFSNTATVMPDAGACSRLCAINDACQAMTYVYVQPGQEQNGECWLKSAVPASSANLNMVSAIKGSSPLIPLHNPAARAGVPWVFHFHN